MSFTTQDLAELERAIASGARSVKYEDRLVEYDSLEDMMARRRLILRELGLADGSGSQHVVQTSRNLGGPSCTADGASWQC